jgi:DNA primase
VTREQIVEHRIGVSYGGRYGYRVVFPIMEGKTLRGIVTRDFTGTQTPKYLNSPGDKWFWGFQPEAETVVLAEGIIKALKIRTATGVSAAALLGHALTAPQRQQLDRSQCKHVVLWPDPDRVGRQGVCKIADDLVGSWPGAVSIVWPVVKPADDMTMAEIQDVWKNATPYTWCMCQRMSLSAG